MASATSLIVTTSSYPAASGPMRALRHGDYMAGRGDASLCSTRVLQKGKSETIDRVSEIAKHLASRGETSFC